MEIIIYSKTLDQLDRDIANTSSKIFEIEFAKALSQYANVSIVSYKAESHQQYKGINLFSLNRNKNISEAMKVLIQENLVFKDSKRVIIAFGYDIRIFYHLKKMAKLFNMKLISYTFDTHKGALYNKNYLKGCLIDVYFKIGIRYVNSIDGIILLNEEAYKEMKLNIPFLISKVGVSEELILPEVYERKSVDIFRMVYSGTLIEYNSIKVLIDTMSYLEKKDIVLEIYGDGPLKEYVECSVKKSANIIYHGLVSNDKLCQEIRKADLLVNLRDTGNYVSKFAFPSKLTQYMSSGIPVLSTKVLNEPEFSQAAFIVEDLDPEKISKKIIHIYHNQNEQIDKSSYGIKFIKSNFLWSDIIKDVQRYLNDL